MKKSWSPIIIDGLLLLAVSTLFVYLLDRGFKTILPSGSDVSNPLVSNILQSATLGTKEKEIPKSLKETFEKNPKLIHQPDEHGDTPLMRTCYVNFDDYASIMQMDRIRLPYVLWLMEHGASPKSLDKDGWNALCWASWSGTIDITKALVKAGGVETINTTDRSGNTPLSIAALRGNPEIIRILLANGANKNSTANNGFKPVDFARQELTRYRAGFSFDPLLDAKEKQEADAGIAKENSIVTKNKSYFNRRNHILRLEESVNLLSK